MRISKLMAYPTYPGHAPGALRRWALGLSTVSLAATLLLPARAQSPGTGPNPAEKARAFKADAKKAKAAYQQGMRAEKAQDWSAAYSAYSDAVSWAPNDSEYSLRREVARSQLVQTKVDAAERDAISGRFDDAKKELLSASGLDPSNRVVRERLLEMLAAEPDRGTKVVSPDIGGEVHLDYQPGTQSIDYRGDTQGAYDELARRFGVEAAFDVDLRPRAVRFRIDDVDFPTAARLLGDMTGTFWRPLTRKIFFVAENTVQKRKDYDASVVRTVLLPASETPDQMTEILRTVREITGITRSDLDMRSRTLTLRASPQAVAVATDLIDGLERPRGELILEMEVLEVDRSYARQLGILPPQSSTITTLTPAQLQDIQQNGTAGIVDVITQIFGSSGVPPIVAFGGGKTTFFATMPGAAANFAEMLSLVKQGRRILLRAQDGEPATFFVGDRVPVSLANFAASFLPGTLGGGTASSTSSLISPITNYPTGNSPQFITTAILRSDSTVHDLMVANSADGTVSVLLGNSDTNGNADGTFATQVTYPVGTDPVWIATGEFDNGATNVNANDFIDIAVANEGSNTISILLGNGDGTFQTQSPPPPLKTGNKPVSVVAADFHNLTGTGALDLAVANQADNTVSIFQGNGNGTFQTPTLLALPAGFEPTSLATAQFTGSGNTDLVVSEQSLVAGNSGIVAVFLGNGDGTFKPVTTYSVGNAPAFVTTGDFNGDGILDLAVANSGAPSSTVSGNSVSILLGNAVSGQPTVGAGTFGTPTNIAAGTEPSSIAVADYDLDGTADLAVADKADNAVTILLNAGNNTFTALPEIATGTAPVSIVTADFNADGRPDAAVADSGAAEATVILNSTAIFGSPLASTTTPFPGAQYIDVGLKVKATPRIHADGDVTLQLSFELSSLTNQNFNSIPVISTNTVEQTVRVKQNETAVLAGMMQAQLTNAIEGNPGIVSVPGIGLFDQNQNRQLQDSELLILVTPRMVRLAPKQNRVIYAGQGAPEGGAGATGPGVVIPPQEQPPAEQPPAPPPAEQPAPPPPAGQPPAEQPPGAGQAPPEQPGEQPPPREPSGRPER